jgi:hypothetical protein
LNVLSKDIDFISATIYDRHNKPLKILAKRKKKRRNACFCAPVLYILPDHSLQMGRFHFILDKKRIFNVALQEAFFALLVFFLLALTIFFTLHAFVKTFVAKPSKK